MDSNKHQGFGGKLHFTLVATSSQKSIHKPCYYYEKSRLNNILAVNVCVGELAFSNNKGEKLN